jgi:hypothetical protein
MAVNETGESNSESNQESQIQAAQKNKKRQKHVFLLRQLEIGIFIHKLGLIH